MSALLQNGCFFFALISLFVYTLTANEVDKNDKWSNNYAVRNAVERRARQLMSVDVVSTVESSPRAVGTARVCRCIRQGMPGQVPAAV